MKKRTAWSSTHSVLVAVACTCFVAPWGVAANSPSEVQAKARSELPANANSDIYGRWRIAKVLGAADIAGMSDQQARAFIGKTIQINEKAFVLDGERCEAPTYARESEDLAKSFREEGHASSAGTGLPDPVIAIDARCTHIFIKQRNVIVVHWKGFYFEAVRRR